MRAAAASYNGFVRRRNEDTDRVDAERGIFLLADGMGGPPGGDVASALAVETAYGLLAERLPAAAPDGILPLLEEALADAHGAIIGRARAEPQLAGMGTTLDVAVVREGMLYLCHAGDSRVYRYRHGSLEQLTRDDNYAAWLVEHGRLPRELVPPHARHVLMQAVGSGAEPVPQLATVPFAGDELVLLCSDGLHGMVADDVIRGIMERGFPDPGRIAPLLVAAALDAGGDDNVSVVVIDPADTPHPPRTT
jgi:protein phosphatase